MALSLNGTSGISGVDGSAGTPALQGTDSNTGISFGTDEVNINTGGSTRVKVDSSGRVGIGNTAPSGANLVINTNSEGGSGIKLIGKSANGGAEIDFRNNADSTLNGFVEFSDTQGVVSTVISGPLTFRTGNTERARIDSSGRLGIGTTSVVEKLDVVTGSGDCYVRTNNGTVTNYFGISSSYTAGFIGTTSSHPLVLGAANAEKARIDTSGRLLVGTSSSSRQTRVSVTGNSGGASNEHGIVDFQFSGTAPGNGWALGYLNFADTSTGDAARIGAERDGGTWTSGSSMPGRLVFSTTANGASSPTERMRIGSNGNFDMPGVYNNTTASAANVFVASGGSMARSTSSVKYKTNIETIEDSYSDALLACRPVWYRSTCEADNPNFGYWGFIAEEVAIIDPRLVHWKTFEITYDESGSLVKEPCEPEPEGVAYDRFVPHLLNLIKRQGEAIAELQAEVAALKGA